jgi:hypothetical protein
MEVKLEPQTMEVKLGASLMKRKLEPQTREVKLET